MTTPAVAERGHHWAAAAWVNLTAEEAGNVAATGRIFPVADLAEQERPIDAVEVICTSCRKPYSPETAAGTCEPLNT